MASYTSYEDWVISRLHGAKNKTLATASLLKLPMALYYLEVEPDAPELERRLRAMRDQGTIASITGRWYLR